MIKSAKNMKEVLKSIVPTVNTNGELFEAWYVYNIKTEKRQKIKEKVKPYFIISFIFLSNFLKLLITIFNIESLPKYNDNMEKNKKQM